MRMKSKVAVGLSLAAVVATTIGSPATAQRRNRDRDAQPARQETPQVGRAFAMAYQPVNAALTANDLAAADAAMAALYAAATTPYERFVAAQTEFRLASAQNDAARQLRAIDGMADSEGVPAADAPRVFLAAGQLAYNARDYAKAARRFERAIALGSTEANLPVLQVDSLLRSNQIDQGLAATRAAMARGPISEQLYGITARALQEANRTPELIEMLVARANAYPTAANLRSLGIIFLQNTPENRGVTLDVMRVLSAANALDDRRYFVEYAAAAVEDGLPNEAITVVNAARAGNFAPASDTTFNEIFATQNAKLAEDRASLAGSARRAATVAEARLATLTGDAYLSYGDNDQAVAMYELALTKAGADADLLNTHIGIARFRAGNLTAAAEAFGRVQGTRATVASMWQALIRSRMPAPAAEPAAAAPAAS